ncbi:alpha-N-acetylgalactosaminide alpha-2,6-sialyltransferase 2-like isoform X1 [Eucyclogobius newberryi]|uniref:alpha-N-acetylgalactosaminide alpha-2,6-sialyltransferase 2-like isoform X1 n=2 Tax=Eucyclogobius newberryi TaxID=166745 RepID=UPI003B5B1E85
MARRLMQRLLLVTLLIALLTVLYVSWAIVTTKHSPVWSLRGYQFSTVPPTTTEPPDLTPIPILHRKDFKKLPQWDFDDQYRTDRERHKTTQKCDSSLWTKIDSDPELRDTFIPNIRMYVFNGSITMSEWNRLSHFNNPFGFMDFNHQDVMNGLNLVPRPRAPLLTPKPGRDCISCAVVGAGGILWRSKKGQEIDNHDYVFRVNGALVKGFEEDVGNRTDIYVHTANSITASEILLSKYKYKRAPHDKGIKYVLIPEGMRDFEWLQGLYKHERLTFGSYKGRRPWTSYSDAFNETRFYLLHMDFLRYVRNRFLKSPTLNAGYWAIVRPTNGAFMIFLALHLCDRVDVYGFITGDHKKYSNYYYERGAKTKVIFYANHNYNLESALWKKLHDLDIIHLYMGPPEAKDPQTTPQPPEKAPQPPEKAPQPPEKAPQPPQKDPQPPQKDPQPPQKTPWPPEKTPQPPEKAPQTPEKAPQTPPKAPQPPQKDPQPPEKAPQTPPKAPQPPQKDSQPSPKAPQPPQKDPQPPQKDPQPPQKTP